MLNHIWISLIAVSILVAVGKDAADEIQNPYRNTVPLEVVFKSSAQPSGSISRWEGELYLTAQQFNSFYGIHSQREEIHQSVSLSFSEDGTGTFYFSVTDSTPRLWKTMAQASSTKNKLAGSIQSFHVSNGQGWATAAIVFEPIRFIKLKAITQAAIDFAQTAVEIAIGLIGVMALWLGLVKIAEEAGLVRLLTKLLAPITRRLFPDVPSDHPAIGAMIMNMAANMLGLNNAATPFGLKAMEELNKLSPKAGTATNAMVTFLAINTGGFVLIPATAIAVRAAVGSSNPGIIIGTSIFGAVCATVAGVLASKLLEKLPLYKISAGEKMNDREESKTKGTRHD